MKKRIISLLLALTMIVGLVPSYSDAASTYKKFPDLTELEANSIRDVISSDIGIMQGDEYGRFNPNKTLTKAEACTIVNRMMGYKNSYLYSAKNFKDVQGHWAYQQIGLSVDLGLALGDGNGYFYPNKTLNGIELITMCLRTIGIGEALDASGNWPSAHMQFVNNEGVIKNYNLNVYEPISRLDAAKIVSQFLTTNIWERDSRTGDYQITDKTILSKYFNIKTYEEVLLTEVNKSERRIEGIYKDDNGQYTKTLSYVYLPSDYNIDDYEVGAIVSISVIGSNVLKISKEDEATNRVVYYNSVVDYDSSEGYLKVKIDGRTTKYLLNEDLLMVMVNGDSEIGTVNNMAQAKRLIEKTISGEKKNDDDDEDDDDDDDDREYDEVSGRIILNSNNKIISISIDAYSKIMYVKSISSSTITGYSGSNYHSENIKTSFKLNNDYEIRDVDGSIIDIDDVDKNDVLLLTNQGEPYSLLKLDDTEYGKVEYLEDEDQGDELPFADKFIRMNGVDYYFNTKFCDEDSLDTLESYEDKGTKITIYLDQNGKIVGWEK